MLTFLDGENYEVISSLQDRDTYCHHVLRKGKISNNQIYTIENDILKRHLQIGEQVFYSIVLPCMLTLYFCTSHQLLVMQHIAVTLAATGPAHGTGTESHSLIIS